MFKICNRMTFYKILLIFFSILDHKNAINAEYAEISMGWYTTVQKS